MKTALVLLASVTTALVLTLFVMALAVPDDCFVSFSGTRPECTGGDLLLILINVILWLLFAVLVVLSAGLALFRLVRRRTA